MSSKSVSKPARSSDPVLNIQIRWMVRRDMDEVLEIERSSFEYAWSENDFLHWLRQRNCIGMVAEQNEHVVGYMIYELEKNCLHIVNFAVAKGCRRSGVGSQMIEKLVGKLSQQRREYITLEVRETNLAAQLFFRDQNFQAVQVLRDHYQDTSEDAYAMQFALHGQFDRQPQSSMNRIADL